jgi:large subunit ribosomal protein L7/L12
MKNQELNQLVRMLIGLNVSEAFKLSHILRDEHNIKISFDTINTIKDKDEAKKPTFDIILIKAGKNRLQVVKLIKEITSLDLTQSKKLMDGVPSKLITTTSKYVVNHIVSLFTELEATVEIS